MSAATPHDATFLSNRVIIRLSGEESRPFLQGLVTQDVRKAGPDAPCWTGLLTPQGKALFDFMLWGDAGAPDDLLIDCEADQADALMKRLTLYRLRRAVGIAREPSLGVHWSRDAADKPFDPRLAALGHRWLGEAGGADASAVFAAHRLALGVLEGVGELGSGETLWLEANGEELNGVAYDKGCYVGQENTARMHYRSKVNRRLVAVPIIEADPKRQRAMVEDQGISIEHRRVEDLAGLPLPQWLADAIADAGEDA